MEGHGKSRRACFRHSPLIDLVGFECVSERGSSSQASHATRSKLEKLSTVVCLALAALAPRAARRPRRPRRLRLPRRPPATPAKPAMPATTAATAALANASAPAPAAEEVDRGQRVVDCMLLFILLFCALTTRAHVFMSRSCYRW